VAVGVVAGLGSLTARRPRAAREASGLGAPPRRPSEAVTGSGARAGDAPTGSGGVVVVAVTAAGCGGGEAPVATVATPTPVSIVMMTSV
jgi:hypothetical protein